jgi:ectoine hydroxylase-related dioxygenase (phytanoyl-CoA dioxygenase family)
MMQPFYVANELLNDEGALTRRFELDGYLFLKQIVDPKILLRLRKQIVDSCAQELWFKPNSDSMDAVAWTTAKVEGEEDYLRVYDQVQRLQDFHALSHDEAIMSVMRKLLGDTAFPHPLSIARLMFPETPEWTTPPHQDHPNNQGTRDLYACWIPLSDCPLALGNLGILAGSHRFGLLPLEYAMGPGHRQVILDERLRTLSWHGGDFQLGDIIIFHSLTVHRSLPNLTDRLRLSVDYRYQREGEPVTPNCLLPHFRRLSWEEIYRNWDRESLKFYWKKKTFPIVPWNDHMHDLPDSHLPDAIGRQMQFDRIRAERSIKYPR